MTERVLVAMSGGVDSSVAAALLVEAGHDVVGATLKLWGGPSDSGCCSVADVDDARAVARRLGIEHHVFNFGDDFDEHVVAPYVADHAAGPHAEPVHRVQPPPEVRPAAPARRRARVRRGGHRPPRPDRGADPTAPDASPAGPIPPRTSPTWCTCSRTTALRRVRFPVGHLTKADVRAEAARLGLATADKPDSQDVCFITATGGRATFLGDRITTRPGRVVDTAGATVGTVPASSSSRSASGAGSGSPAAATRATSSAVDVSSGHGHGRLRGRPARRQVVLADLAWVGRPGGGPLPRR